MTLLSYDDLNFRTLPDQDLLRSIFNTARQALDTFVSSHGYKGTEYQTRMDQNFMHWMESLRVLTTCPDMDQDQTARTLALAMIVGAYEISMYNNEAPLQTLRDMRAAYQDFPQGPFLDAAIREIEDDYRGMPASGPSVAEDEHAILNTVRIIRSSEFMLARGIHLKQYNIAAQPMELRNWDRTIARFDALNRDKVPASLHGIAEKQIAALKVSRAGFSPA